MSKIFLQLPRVSIIMQGSMDCAYTHSCFDGVARGGYYGFVKKASITQTKNQLSALLDRGHPVARLEPALQEGEGNDAGRLARLERAGILRLAISPARSRLLLEPPPKPKKGASILQALLAERRTGGIKYWDSSTVVTLLTE